MKILITGGAGFIRSHLCDALIGSGAKNEGGAQNNGSAQNNGGENTNGGAKISNT